MNPLKAGNKYLLVLLLVFVAVFLVAVRPHGQADREQQAGTKGYTMADVVHANYANVFIYDGKGGVASFMIGGRTPEFSSLAGGIAAAEPAGGEADATFSDLIVFSFSGNRTLEFPYSGARNRFVANGQVFQPAADLAPVVDNVAKRLA